MSNRIHTKVEKSFSLKKSERLKRKKIIDQLFAEGSSLLQFPLKMIYLETALPKNCPAQAGFTTSKKIFKRAVHRNYIKRLLRESYRKNKHIIYLQPTKKQLAIFIIYIGKKIPNYQEVEAAMQKGLAKIALKQGEAPKNA